jgi:ArsR family transcriptional regulator, arsenate/arsenite/antimonite-responsive transcriptional repressor
MATENSTINSIADRKSTLPVLNDDPCCAPAPRLVDTERINVQARVLAAIADPTRLGIISMLAGQAEPMCVCEITPQFDLGQPTISHHLRILREAQLVDCVKRGLWVYYWLNRPALNEVTSYLASLQPR